MNAPALSSKLGDVADFINGAAFKPEDWGQDGLKIIRIQNLTDPSKPYNRTNRQVSERLHVQHGDLLVSWSATLAVFQWQDSEVGVLNQHIFRVLPDAKKVDKRYLRYALELSLLDMRKHLHGATMLHVNRGEFLSTEIYLPPLPEQRRIAAILDQAYSLRAKRREALAQLDSLTQSIFIEMFGDVDGSGWSISNVADIADACKGSIRTGPFGSQLLHSEFVDDGVVVLGIDNAVRNEFRWGERRFISPQKYQELKRYTVLPGDVLITIMGTCGRCAVVPADIPVAINTKHICCITLNAEKCLPSFLHSYFLMHPMARKYLAQTAKGAIMDGLNMGIIKAMPVPLVPLQLQHEFEARLKALQKTKSANNEAANEHDTLFTSLQHRAFRGEL